MNQGRASLLALLLASCGQQGASEGEGATPPPQHIDVRAEFLRLAGNDPWAKWPDRQEEGPYDDGRPCVRVAEGSRDGAIARLAAAPAVSLSAREYRDLTGAAPPPAGDGTFHLLRGFSSTNSVSRVKVRGSAVTVHSDALGGLFNLRRHPCIALLTNTPSEVYTVAAYDL